MKILDAYRDVMTAFAGASPLGRDTAWGYFTKYSTFSTPHCQQFSAYSHFNVWACGAKLRVRETSERSQYGDWACC